LRLTHAQYDPVHHALGDIPSPFRDAAMAAFKELSTTLILNNGGQLSTHSLDSNNFEPVHQLASFPVDFSSFDQKERPWAKRDWLLSELRELRLQGVKWLTLSPENIWLWRRAFRQAVRKNEEVENSAHNSFREFNFSSCGAAKSWGWEVSYADGDRRLSAFSCGETACPGCYDRDKARTARRYLDRISAAASAQKMDRFWSFVITLPEQYEADVPKGSEKRRRLLHEIKKFERKLFGFKTEDGLFAFASVHAVGDSNLMRDRFHVHSGVLPIAVRRINKQPQIIKSQIQGKIDVKAAREELAKHLRRVFPSIDKESIQFNAKFYSLKTEKDIRKLAHRLKYDLRGFGKDIEKSPIFFDPQSGLAVLNGGKDDYGVYTISQVAWRWRWIRNQRDLRSWGLLNQWNKYAELLGVEFVEDPEPEVTDETPVTVIRSYGREWDKKRAQVKWVDIKVAFRESGEEIENIEWGRKGSEGNWRPISKTNNLGGTG